ncbi:uncharacterized protein MAM_03519 [Metarhizium album ARSEF 1941]|uniref:Thymidylate kinase n=1 Tax=Metarhizium album (strain ARSEF 1941) TaxID=1081103 RepID=A0A0B2WZY6_METAS|nr:uncharacterized protein MAM_03519 [Metarhizium album ARSEF 1941]KHN98395.1 hypothetical protein MAM_03519 [Metarhizium album ARSEF 1941]
MATLSRQPFAPLDAARLQGLTSLKNRQNVVPPSNTKRKAELLHPDDSENVDPVVFAKRTKGASGTPTKDVLRKPASYLVTRAAATPSANLGPLVSPVKPSSTAPRRTLQPKSPIAKLNTRITRSSPSSAPAGRSPTRGKRSGILSNRRQSAGPCTSVNPPSFSLDSAAPFSLDAALKGTIASYAPRPRSNALSRGSTSTSSLGELDAKAGWFFDIHEDTPEQEMTNLLQHSTCVLDISSDEESKKRASRENAEGRDKENIPPVDDVSQTSVRRARARTLAADDMAVDKERVALGEMKTADFYADGCDESSVIFVPADDEDQEKSPEKAPAMEDCASIPGTLKRGPASKEIDELMAKSESPLKAAVLRPIEGTGESFDLWESGSAKDESELS